MRKKSFNKKLMLSKITISNLDNNMMNMVNGGRIYIPYTETYDCMTACCTVVPVNCLSAVPTQTSMCTCPVEGGPLKVGFNDTNLGSGG